MTQQSPERRLGEQVTPRPERSCRWLAATAQTRAGRLARGGGEAPRPGQCLVAGASAAPPATYLHVADNGLEEASERAAFLLNHSLHFPGAGKDRTHTRGCLDCARDRCSHTPGGILPSGRPTSDSQPLLRRGRTAQIDCSLPQIIIILKAKPLCRVIRLHAVLGSWP